MHQNLGAIEVLCIANLKKKKIEFQESVQDYNETSSSDSATAARHALGCVQSGLSLNQRSNGTGLSTRTI